MQESSKYIDRSTVHYSTKEFLKDVSVIITKYNNEKNTLNSCYLNLPKTFFTL